MIPSKDFRFSASLGKNSDASLAEPAIASINAPRPKPRPPIAITNLGTNRAAPAIPFINPPSVAPIPAPRPPTARAIPENIPPASLSFPLAASSSKRPSIPVRTAAICAK